MTEYFKGSMSECGSYIAVDLGAESGRICVGDFDGERLFLTEAARFTHSPVQVGDGLHWDVLSIFQSITDGLTNATSTLKSPIRGVGIDSWAVDFALLDSHGALVGNPFSYRDGRTINMIERACARADQRVMYETTGIQFNRINTVYQLLAMEDSPQLAIAHRLLMIPDLFTYWLSGEMVSERTNASTTQLYDVQAREWAWDLQHDLRVPSRIFGPLISPGTRIGCLLPNVAERIGMARHTPVFAVASHDTASAVAGIPASSNDFGYISSGTWSLVGIERREPVLTEAAMDAGFTNEEGFDGTTRFLKNVMGLWLLQECRRQWSHATGRSLTYDELTSWAEEAGEAVALIDPDSPEFLAPGDMHSRICDFCAATGQARPRERAECVRTIFESLALKYRWTLDRAEELAGSRIKVVHIVGGGSSNRLLCRLTAGATERIIAAGPVEATAVGNVMVQAWARGEVDSLREIRAVVRSSVPVQLYEPEEHDAWEDRYGRFLAVLSTTRRKPTTVAGRA